jgi:predicted HTH transcriptional regulator
MKATDLDILLQEGEGVMLEYTEGYPEPEFSETGFFSAVFRPIPAVSEQDTRQVGTKSEPSRDHVEEHLPHMYRISNAHVAVLKDAMAPKTRDALQMVTAIRHRQHFYREYLHPLLKAGLLEMTIPDKPRSSKQRYRTTPAGRAVLENAEKDTQT